jgi:hypothetical protein
MGRCVRKNYSDSMRAVLQSLGVDPDKPRPQIRKRTPKKKRKSARRTKRGLRARSVDPRDYGLVFPSSYLELGGDSKTIGVACRWVGDDFVITVPEHLPPWRKWPPDKRIRVPGTGIFIYPFSAFKRYWRRSTYNHCVKAIMEFSGITDLRFERTTGRVIGLWERLSSMEIVRLAPERLKLFDPDSLVHWGHHLRDGMQDVYAGYVTMKDQRRKWLGQDADNEAHPLYRHVSYRQEKIPGDCYGHQFVFKFPKVEIVR